MATRARTRKRARSATATMIIYRRQTRRTSTRRAGAVRIEHDGQQRGDDVPVELRAGVGAQLVGRLLRREGVAVAAIAGHRVPGVAREDDAGPERDALAGQAVGVAAAVPAFVAGAPDPADGAQRLGRADDALADDRVLADEAPLGVVERAGLVQDRVRDGDLADVVQLGGADHDVEVLGIA